MYRFLDATLGPRRDATLPRDASQIVDPTPAMPRKADRTTASDARSAPPNAPPDADDAAAAPDTPQGAPISIGTAPKAKSCRPQKAKPTTCRRKTPPTPTALRKRDLIKQERGIQRRRFGRPTTYVPEVGLGICRDIACGMTFKQACQERGLSTSGVWQWRQRYPEFADAYARAIDMRMDYYVHEIEAISDGSGDVKRDTLRVDTRKWIASKLAPRRYGDRVALTDGNGDPLARYREMTDAQRLQEAQQLVVEAHRVLERAKAEGMTIEGEVKLIEEK